MTATNSAHGWRVTWPMVLGWLGVLALLWPVAGPYILGEKPFDTAAGTTILAVLLSALNHSPAPLAGGLPRPPDSVVVFLLFVLGAAALTGCGASALQVHATIATTTAAAIDSSGDAIVHAEGRELDAAVAAATSEAEGHDTLARIHDRYAPLVAAHDALAAAQRAYVDGILAVAAKSSVEALLVRLALTLLTTWRELARDAAAVGLDVPQPPTLLAGAAGDTSP